MIKFATGILLKIHTFLHGLIYPPPVEEDEFSFLDDIAWLQETERMRRDAMLFWSDEASRQYGSTGKTFIASQFYEKHTTTLPELDLLNLKIMSTKNAQQSADLIFEPVRKASGFIPPANGGPVTPLTTNHTLDPVRSFMDPLEDLYEPVDENRKQIRTPDSQPYNDLYAVIMKMSTIKKQP